MKNMFFIVFFIFVSCDSNVYIDDFRHVYLSTNASNTPISLNYFISEVKAVKLKETDGFLVGTVSKLKKIENRYYVLDDKYAKSLFCFDCEGNPIARFSNIGAGPNEYSQILDFDINEENGDIAILCYPNKVFVMDLNLTMFKKVKTLKKNAQRLVYEDCNLLLYNHTDEELIKISSDYENESIFYSWKKTDGKYLFPPQFVFYKAHDDLYFHPPGLDSLYMIKKDKCMPYMVFDFNNKIDSYELYKVKYSYEFSIEELINYPLPRIHSIFYWKEKPVLFYTLGMIISANMPDFRNNERRENEVFSYSISDVVPYGENILIGWCNGSDLKDYKDLSNSSIPLQFSDESVMILEYKLK